MKKHWAVLAVAVALLAACSNGDDDDRGGATNTTSTTPGASTTGGATTTNNGRPVEGATFAVIPDVVDLVQPSVVSVITDRGQGSGVVYRTDGIIVTNNHVVEGAERVQVAFADGDRVTARVRARDPVVDLAVLETERRNLTPVPFTSSLPRVGELAIALGDPLGFESSVTAGVISGLHRSIPGSTSQSLALVDLIQTDAAISPGNSGGALVNGRGEVVGVNVAYLPPQTGGVAIGFAIPAATVTNTVNQLLETGQARHAFAGLRPITVTAQLAQRFGLAVEQGALVRDVTDGGPADNVGIEPGDVITAVNGERIADAEAFVAALRRQKPGDTITVTVQRGSAPRDVRLRLSERP